MVTLTLQVRDLSWSPRLTHDDPPQVAILHLSVMEAVSRRQHPLVRDKRPLASLLTLGLQGRDSNLGLLCLAVFNLCDPNPAPPS